MKTIVAFDFDGTITNKDTLLEFIRYVFGNGQFIVGFLLHAPLLVAYKCHLYPNWKAKRRIFAWFFKGMPLETFNAHCGRFFLAKGKELLREQAVGCIAGHLKAGHEVVIVSASIDNWVLPFADVIGVRCVIGTQVEISSSNCLTGAFLTPNCYGQEKVHRLLEHYPDRQLYHLIAYGDSGGDSELLAFANDRHYKPFRKPKLLPVRGTIAYLVFGVCTTAVNVAAYNLCYEQMGVSNVVSTVIAWVAAVLFAFLTNKPFVFGSRSWAVGLVLAEGAKFFGCRLGTGVVEVAGMYVLVDILRLDGTLMKLLINVLVIILNYVFGRFFVFVGK